ncbi:hypothetical protein IMZ38_04210 [Thermosphaera chiliense]|uniref:Uncharacterized protein n=1 Tax=Thermosphaera chiliense TaxID=3402707 RepID=A0A7M1UNS8_9CREN|nr:hypothetical protein [Thermosphaera aggregans]QOR93861.1 hypothetical protein IMZ38_04210 [Thermosphaera aggregans]
MKDEKLTQALARIIRVLNNEYGKVVHTFIKKGVKNTTIIIKLEKNISSIRTVKIKVSSDGSKIRVYTGATSLDLRLKRLLRTELLKGD